VPDIPSAAVAKAVESISRVRPWRAIRRHDRLAGEEYEDLITWAKDDLQKEGRALDGVKNELIEPSFSSNAASVKSE
jgi:hypothetical protein